MCDEAAELSVKCKCQTGAMPKRRPGKATDVSLLLKRSYACNALPDSERVVLP